MTNLRGESWAKRPKVLIGTGGNCYAMASWLRSALSALAGRALGARFCEGNAMKVDDYARWLSAQFGRCRRHNCLGLTVVFDQPVTRWFVTSATIAWPCC